MPGVDPEQWARAERLRVEGVALSFSVGLHPWHAALPLDGLEAWVERLGAVAIGEVGWDRGAEASLERQDEVADTQLAIATQLDLPVVLHVVGLHGHAIERLSRHRGLRGLVHGYSGSAELVARYVAMGLSVSVGPSVLREGARRPLEAARAVPAERLLLETDAPDQGAPARLADVLTRVAEARDEPPEELAERTWRNASELLARR